MPGFHLEHFGCRAARADGEAVSERLRAAGHSVRQPSAADVVIVNTCSVTAEADRAARAFIRRAHRLNPAARIVVTGCYAQRAPQELAGLAGVAAVVGNSHKAFVPRLALSLMANAETDAPVAALQAQTSLVQIQAAQAASASTQVVWADDRFAHSFLDEAQLVPGSQTRPNLKIQEGCGNRCTFCVIPLTRGPSRSLPAAHVLEQVSGFVEAGGNELVLSGINLGRWGRDVADSESAQRASGSGSATLSEEGRGKGGTPGFPGSQQPVRTLADLVRRIFDETELPRLRLSSIEPMDWGAELIGLMREFGGVRLARHAHLPLQSGSDAVLRRMHRRYRPWHYEEKVWELVEAAGPELTLGGDVMAGFPGETEREFEETLELLRRLPFGYLHLFPFSPRPGTPGWALNAERPVKPEAVEERIDALRALAAEKSITHRRSFVGRELNAITLRASAKLEREGRTEALTENFLPVHLEGRLPANRMIKVRTTGMNTEGALLAVPVQNGAMATSV